MPEIILVPHSADAKNYFIPTSRASNSGIVLSYSQQNRLLTQLNEECLTCQNYQPQATSKCFGLTWTEDRCQLWQRSDEVILSCPHQNSIIRLENLGAPPRHR